MCFIFLYVHFTRILFLRVFLFFFLFLHVFLNLLVAWNLVVCLRFRPPAVTLIGGVLSGGVLSGGVLSGGVLSGDGVLSGGVLSGSGGVVTDAYNVIAFVNLSMYFLVLEAHFSSGGSDTQYVM